MKTNRQCSYSNRHYKKTYINVPILSIRQCFHRRSIREATLSISVHSLTDSVAILIDNLASLTDSQGTSIDNVATLVDSLATLTDRL